MFHSLLMAGAILDDSKVAIPELKSKIVAASIFKPGVALIVRQVEIPAGKGKFKLDVLPEILDGSFWYGSSEGIQIGDVQTKLRFEDKKVTIEAQSILDYLLANKGKEATLKVMTSKDVVEAVHGSILSASGNGVTLRLDNGNLRTVFPNSIVELETKGLSDKVEQTVPSVVQEIDFDADAKRPGTVRFVTLENGAAWSGSYLVELDNTNHAKVSGKAQIVVGSLTFEGTEVQVLAGMPTLPQTPKFDLTAGFGSMIAYLKGTQESYRAYRQGPRDPYSQIAQVLARAQSMGISHDAYPYGGGGFGGGGLGGGQGAYFGNYPGGNQDLDMLSSQGYRQIEEKPQEPAFVEDLFSYPLGKLSLDPGDRLTRKLLDDTADYERMFRWELSTWMPRYENRTDRSRVVKILRLQNRSKVPWTGGLALVLKDGSPLAQTDMPYTAAGQDASLVLGEVQDIPVSKEARETAREQVHLLQEYRTAVTVETTLTVQNTRSEPVKIEIRYDLSGEVLSAEGAEVKTLGTLLNGYNRTSRVTWLMTLKPGEKREFKMTSKTIV